MTGEERVRGKVQTAGRLLALGPQWPPLHAASAVATLARNLVRKHYGNQQPEFSQTANRTLSNGADKQVVGRVRAAGSPRRQPESSAFTT